VLLFTTGYGLCRLSQLVVYACSELTLVIHMGKLCVSAWNRSRKNEQAAATK